ncbi:hypothetical protein BYZ73_12815 [Rhodovulum viride]|uniref:Uncharacterized protein n=1 Tax=Rhodovulum viride TaxID=1231134 RepID=A0ABX9DGN4_9RHOB|nr:CZB domain-containing protein [Rhodovulum viride]RAP40849.1 hypothetical protein BYZ73_12815 [Rhodovulum viride]
MPISRSMVGFLDNAIQSHLLLKGRLRHAVLTGHAWTTPQEIACDTGCDLARLLAGPGLDPAMRATPRVQEITRTHSAFHACAARILQLVNERRIGSAERVLGVELRDISDRMNAEIAAWQDEILTESFRRNAA